MWIWLRHGLAIIFPHMRNHGCSKFRTSKRSGRDPHLELTIINFRDVCRFALNRETPHAIISTR
ncbi:hypothetical protein GGQ67_003593 [Rhizobium metallidurans]|uniref:Uncharacterized protein n=1 Tax=Rhizobium metallidurans TaxID=1265931 RepID=A0A7W6CWS7_9HYPH|nr:hypothetical protein [Rhizobium metallidurans]